MQAAEPEKPGNQVSELTHPEFSLRRKEFVRHIAREPDKARRRVVGSASRRHGRERHALRLGVTDVARYLLDSNHVTYLLQGHPSATTELANCFLVTADRQLRLDAARRGVTVENWYAA